MTNKEISRALRMLSSLMELHDENPFKIKSITNASFQVDRAASQISEMTEAEILSIPGIGKSMAAKIYTLLTTGMDPEMDEMLEKTPAGIVEILQIKGIGPKKVRTLWKELEIESTGELLYACNENRLVELKGFGAKTQESIRQSLEFSLLNAGKLHFAEAEAATQETIKLLEEKFPNGKFEITGELRRQNETIDHSDILCISNETVDFTLHNNENLQFSTYGEFTLLETSAGYRFRIYHSKPEQANWLQFSLTGPSSHVKELNVKAGNYNSEVEIYRAAGTEFISPVLRDWTLLEASELAKNTAVNEADIKGILHCHSTWSDGADTLEQMAKSTQALGKEYFGICDHSKSAFYANGLSIERVLAQHTEIDKLNQKFDNFKIFKGIESDILSDGSLDYPDEILATFDFIVASVHSVLRMDEERATTRLIKAVENQYTTILGHPSTRLLLSRKGFPINYPKLIDACAANGVSIELNAHPYRLDIDWRLLPLCVEKGVKIAINPDSHRKEGLSDIRYGVLVAQKAGLSANDVLNNLSLQEFSKYINK
jgi:DNA polymerase (family 10)